MCDDVSCIEWTSGSRLFPNVTSENQGWPRTVTLPHSVTRSVPDVSRPYDSWSPRWCPSLERFWSRPLVTECLVRLQSPRERRTSRVPCETPGTFTNTGTTTTDYWVWGSWAHWVNSYVSSPPEVNLLCWLLIPMVLLNNKRVNTKGLVLCLPLKFSYDGVTSVVSCSTKNLDPSVKCSCFIWL